MLQETIVVRKKTEFGFMEFLKLYGELLKKGYEPDWDQFIYKSQPHFNHAFALTVFKKELEDMQKEEVERINLDLLEDKKSSKEDLLKLAEVLAIDVPEDKAKYPAGLRKYLKEELDNKNNKSTDD